jgi:hypothetical protein
VSKVEEAELDPGIGSVERLFATRGRSSTPPPPNEAKIKLADMLRLGYHSSNPNHPNLKIATIVHDELYDELEKSYTVMPLLPSTLVNTVDAGQPKMIVIHRSAFQDGPWFGAEDAAGGASADTIRRLLPWSRKRQVPVLFIENGTPDRYFTKLLREIGTEVFPSEHSASNVPEGAARRSVYRIALRSAKAPYVPMNEGGI